MKKVSVFITALLLMSFIIIPTNFVQAMSMDEVIRNVEQTNIQINEEIEKAVYTAQEAFNDYNYDLMVLLNDKEICKIGEELCQLQDGLNSVEGKSKKQKEIQKLEEKYNAEIDKIIENLLDVTNKMSAKMVADAAKEGVTVYCEWVEVTLGGRTILVDPIRIGNYDEA